MCCRKSRTRQSGPSRNLVRYTGQPQIWKNCNKILREYNLRGISSTEDDALLVGELDLLVFTCEVEGSNALLAIKAKEEALSQPVEVEGLPPGLTTVGTEDLALCISYQEHCIVTVLNV